MRILLILLFLSYQGLAQTVSTPLEKNNYLKVTSHKEIQQFIKELQQKSTLVTVDSIGKSIEGRNLYALRFSRSEFGKDKSKIKVLFLAQQHGNEQSGKEGALLLARELIKKENSYLFDKMDIAIIPQMNPDGSEANKRRNGNKIDLNRSHLILTEPELIALHNFFDKYLFEVTMDVHEYYPYGDDTEKFGFRRNFDEQLGVPTNINVSREIRDLGNNEYIPFIKKYLNDKNFSFFVYSPGGPPDNGYVRHSTFDINDGRQSFAIQNTFSFIQEGLNGKDNLIDRIKHRSEGQMTGMFGLVEFSYNHQKQILKMVHDERNKLLKGKANEPIAIQLAHANDGSTLRMPLLSYRSGKDSIFTIVDYRPIVKSLFDVSKPIGYLIPVTLTDIVSWAQRHNLKTEPFRNAPKYKIENYFIASVDSIDFEGENVVNPNVELKECSNKISNTDYIFIPTNQLKGNLIVTALEPKSILGLVTYKIYSNLLRPKEYFPILRVTAK